jgi:hypothetical protein
MLEIRDRSTLSGPGQDLRYPDVAGRLTDGGEQGSEHGVRQLLGVLAIIHSLTIDQLTWDLDRDCVGSRPSR